MKIFWFDTETTGTDPTLHSMIQIAGIIDIDGEIKEKFNLYTQPHPDFLIDESSVKIHGLTTEKMNSFPKMETTHLKLKKIFEKYVDKYNPKDKFIAAGQNVKFDINILYHFFTRLKDTFLGSYIDFRERKELFDIAKAMKTLGFLRLENLKLESICKELGIKINPHEASSDIYAAREAYYTIINNLQWRS